jgi:hypothetical protein
MFYWSPRVLGILFAAFISMFALDAVQADRGFWVSLAALLIHLVPTVLVLLTLMVAWRWEWLGALLFAALGGLYLLWSWGQFGWPVYAMIAGPPLCIGLLFVADGLYRRTPVHL